MVKTKTLKEANVMRLYKHDIRHIVRKLILGRGTMMTITVNKTELNQLSVW